MNYTFQNKNKNKNKNMDKNELIGVDHIISIEYLKKEPTDEYRWVPSYKNSIGFLKKIEKIFPGYYENNYGNVVGNLKEYVSKNDSKGRLVILKGISTEEEGPEGTVYIKPRLKYTTIGGRYTMESFEYFDSEKEAFDKIQEINHLYTGKFLIKK